MGATTNQHGQQLVEGSTSLEQLAAIIVQKDEKIALLERHVSRLIDELTKLRGVKFGEEVAQRSIKAAVDSLLHVPGTLPFPGLAQSQKQAASDKQETIAQEAATSAAIDTQDSARSTKTRRRGPRNSFPEHLPRKVVRVELPEDRRQAPCGGVMKEIGVEVTRKIERLSFTYVEETHQVKYACAAHPEEGVRVGATRPSVIEGGLLGVSMLADVIVERMGNHMPYHRLEQKYGSEGLSLSRSVLCNAAHRCAELLEPIYQAQFRQILADTLVQFDATGVVVRHGQKEGRGYGHMWTYRGQTHGLRCFQFTTDKCSEKPMAVLGSYSGLLQCDAASNHDALFVDGTRTEVGCWSHAFRRFEDAKESEATLAGEGLSFIGQLYAIERRGKSAGLGVEGRAELRQRESRPVLDKFRTWLEVTLTKVLPAGPLAKAIRYVRNQWRPLTRFVDDGRIEEIDNNLCEQALRQVAVGRKNWLFIGAEERGHSNAVLMSLVSTCKAIGVNPSEFLRDVLVRLAIETDVERLTPLGWKRDQAAAQRTTAARQAIASVVRSFAPPRG